MDDDAEFDFMPDTQLPVSLTCTLGTQSPQFSLALPNSIDFGLSGDLNQLKGIGNLGRNVLAGSRCASTNTGSGSGGGGDHTALPPPTTSTLDAAAAPHFVLGGGKTAAPVPPPSPAAAAAAAAAASDIRSMEEPVYDLNPRRLIVNFLPPQTTNAGLRALFSPFGPIKGAYIAYDKDTGPKGYGFVKFCDVSAADTAIEAMNGYTLLNKRLKVARARAKGEPSGVSFSASSSGCSSSSSSSSNAAASPMATTAAAPSSATVNKKFTHPHVGTTTWSTIICER